MIDIPGFFQDYENALIKLVVDAMNAGKMTIKDCADYVSLISLICQKARVMHSLGDEDATQLLVDFVNAYIRQASAGLAV